MSQTQPKILIKDNKAYANKNYSLNDTICTSSWLEMSSNLTEERSFAIPKPIIKLGDAEAMLFDDIFYYVNLSDDEAKNINANEKHNVDAYVDAESKIITFIANKKIKCGEEITYNLHPDSFNHVTLQ